jgi:hypothetical protein
MIIRAWVEEGSSEPLRAHVRVVTGVSTGEERTMTLCRVEAVCATVKDWLTDIVGPPGPAEGAAGQRPASGGGLGEVRP